MSVRWLFMPYCVQKITFDKSDRRYRSKKNYYVVLNRHYKPLGMKGDYVDYANYAVPIKGLTRTKVLKIAHKPDLENLDVFYFYDDSCVPDSNKASMDSYLERLSVFMKLKHDYRPH